MKLIVWFCVFGTIASVISVPTTLEESPKYTLPDSITPSNYKIALTLSDGIFQDGSSTAFQGSVQITLRTLEERDTILLHHRDLTLKSATLQDITDPKAPGAVVSVGGLTNYDAITEIVTLSVPIYAFQSYILKIEYEGNLNSVTRDGFYKGSYLNSDNKNEYFAATAFKPTSARAAFPSFDQIDLKATFKITIISPLGFKVFSNTIEEDSTSTETTHFFKPTPIMSTYLVAFVIAKFECFPKTETSMEVCARPGLKDLTTLAGETGFKALDFMKGITGIDYYDVTNYGGPGKITQVALPDFAAGAMENWGLVTYREDHLLWDPKESSELHKQKVITAVAHEIAHQWFGDLVTMIQWRDVFLSEGFATFYAYAIGDMINPDLDLKRQFIVDVVQTALAFDTSKSALPLSITAEDPDSISHKFDVISYNKGGSIFRMVQSFLGNTIFKTGLNNYLKKYNHGSTYTSYLWESFPIDTTPSILPPRMTLEQVMNSWISEQSYPLVTVTSTTTGIKVSQTPFAGVNKNSLWYIPITYTTSSVDVHPVPNIWLTPQENITLDSVPTDIDWIIVNPDRMGYYRVDYDDVLWGKISTALSQNLGYISDINRAQIVDDLFQLAKFNVKTYSNAFELSSFLANETNYFTWVSAFNNFEFLLKRIDDQRVRIALMEVISQLAQKFYSAYTFDKKQTVQIGFLAQELALTWAGKLNIKDSVNKSKELFASYIADPVKGRVDPNLRTVVYCNGIRYSDNVKDDHQKLYDQYGKTDLASEREIISAALGCASDADVLKSYLQQVISSDTKIRVQDGKAAITSVLIGNPSNVDVVLDFLVSNYDQINTRFGDKKTFNSILSSTVDRITNNGQSDKIDTFAKISTLDQSTKDALERATDSIKTNLEMGKNLEKGLRTYLGLSSAPLNGAMFSLTLFIALAIALI